MAYTIRIIIRESCAVKKRIIMLKNFLREYNINRIFLSTIGLWPFQNKLIRNLLRSFSLLIHLSYFGFEILLLYDHWDNVLMIFEGLYQVVVTICFVIRMGNGLLKNDKLKKLYQTIDEHWNIFNSDTDIRVLTSYSTLSRKFTKYYSGTIYVMMSIFIITPLKPIFLDVILPLNESRPRIFAIEVEFRVDKNEYFLPISCYTTLMIVVGINIMVAVDAMHVTCTAHACSLFAAVSQGIENIISKLNNNNKDECAYYINTELEVLDEKKMFREYIICLKKHQLAIEFVDTLESSYQEFSLMILILGIALISLIAFRIVLVLNQFGEMIRFVFLIIGGLVALFIVCYSGQKLMDESQNVFYRACTTDWYNHSPRLKSLLIITLYRSNIPCGLKAGNMIPLSITTYAAVIRMGMSYFTAFLSLQE